ncbi:MAG: hypothetical protein KDA84_06280 [Planctomycetaceae bacterium]|nr:hypothetical protein [Planctomycetaceae bacterium]
MNNEYYKQVLEDVQKDLAEVEQTVSELQGVERYVQKKMEKSDSADGNGKLSYDQYQSLLEDIRGDQDGARSKIGELRGVGNFAREKLKAAGVEVGEIKAPSRPATPKPATPQSDDETTQEEKSPVQVDSTKTVEFGPDGFPMPK